MSHITSYRSYVIAMAVAFAGTLAVPAIGAAQAVTGQARAVQATTALGTTTLADTGTLASADDSRDAVAGVANVGTLFSGEVLHAVTVGLSDGVASQVSAANVAVRVGTTAIAADLVMAYARALLGTGASARSVIGNLTINGVPVAVTGQPNQQIAIPGGVIVLNERRESGDGITVNALRASVQGLANVVIGSATAGIQ